MHTLERSLCLFCLREWHYCCSGEEVCVYWGRSAAFTGLWLVECNADEDFIHLCSRRGSTESDHDSPQNSGLNLTWLPSLYVTTHCVQLVSVPDILQPTQPKRNCASVLVSLVSKVGNGYMRNYSAKILFSTYTICMNGEKKSIISHHLITCYMEYSSPRLSWILTSPGEMQGESTVDFQLVKWDVRGLVTRCGKL